MTLVLAEDVVDEVYAVIEETFRDHHDLPRALGLLDAVFGSGELIQRREYLENVAKWGGDYGTRRTPLWPRPQRLPAWTAYSRAGGIF